MRQYSQRELIKVVGAAAARLPPSFALPRAPRQVIEAHKLRRLRAMLKRAYATRPFYRAKLDAAGVDPRQLSSLAEFSRRVPLTTKAQVLANHSAIVPPDVSDVRYIRSCSSGSTGAFLDVWHDPVDTHAYVLGRFRHLWMLTPYLPWIRVMYIYTSLFPAQSVGGLYPHRFVETLAPIEEAIGALDAFGPHVLNLYPSHLQTLSSLAPEALRRAPLKLILVGSELSTQQQRDSLADQLGCPVYDEYSSEELGWISAQCTHGRYHVFEDLVHLEIVSPETGLPCAPGEVGEIVGTNLVNTATPFIRYRQGDLGAFTPEPCPCGSHFQTMGALVGRQNSSFDLGGQTWGSGYLLDLCYNIVLKAKVQAQGFCLKQTHPDHVELELLMAEDDPQGRARLTAYIGARLPARITVTRVQALHTTRSGKRNPIINLVATGRVA